MAGAAASPLLVDESLIAEYKTIGLQLASVFGFKGPVHVVPTMCSSSLIALDAARNAIKLNVCDRAVVLGLTTVGIVEATGIVGAVLLEKKWLSKRFYAKMIDSRVSPQQLAREYNDYTLVGDELSATTTGLAQFLKQVYAQNHIDLSLVDFIELQGVASSQLQQLKSVSELLAAESRIKRTVPLFVGTTLTGEQLQQQLATSGVLGLLGLIRMLVSIQRGVIPTAGKYEQEPSREIAALIAAQQGRIQLNHLNGNVNKFFGGILALNSVDAVNGTLAHILLQPNCDYAMSQQLEKVNKQFFIFENSLDDF